MAKEYSYTIPTRNYGDIDFSYTDRNNTCLILFIVGAMGLFYAVIMLGV